MVSDQARREPHLVVKTWRDRDNPDAGGAEVWLHEVLSRLATRGWRVTVLTMGYPGSADDQVVDGIRHVRRGGTVTQYARAHLSQWRVSPPPDVVLDVFNGVPFLSALWPRPPVVVVVHHVHREQWAMVFGDTVGRLGWAVERWSARRQRGRPHVTVSEASARALTAAYGVAADRIAIAHNGFTAAPDGLPVPDLVRADHRLVVVGRLVPHKRVEVAIAALVAARAAGLDTHLDVVGEGEWRTDLEAEVGQRGLDEHVTLHGFVDDATKHAILAAADVHVLASVREGWGIVVAEAGQHGVPTVALARAGGTRESVVDGVSGELASDDRDLVERVVALLTDPARRERLGAGARDMAGRFSWTRAADVVEQTLVAAIADHRQQ